MQSDIVTVWGFSKTVGAMIARAKNLIPEQTKQIDKDKEKMNG